MVQIMKGGLRKCVLDGGEEQGNEILPYIAMGHRMSKQKSRNYSPSFLMFERDTIIQSRFQKLQEEELELSASLEELVPFPNLRGQAFKRMMPLAMRYLAIAEQQDMERYRLMRGGG